MVIAAVTTPLALVVSASVGAYAPHQSCRLTQNKVDGTVVNVARTGELSPSCVISKSQFVVHMEPTVVLFQKQTETIALLLDFSGIHCDYELRLRS